MNDIKDGRWHAGQPQQHNPLVKNRFGIETRKLVYSARFFRFVDGEWQHEHCSHTHFKHSVADKCAQQTVNRRNKDV